MFAVMLVVLRHTNRREHTSPWATGGKGRESIYAPLVQATPRRVPAQLTPLPRHGSIAEQISTECASERRNGKNVASSANFHK